MAKVFKVKNEIGEWVTVPEPAEGQVYQLHDEAGGFVESIYKPPVDDVEVARISTRAFKLRMTATERKATRAKQTNADVVDFMDILSSGPSVNLADPLVMMGLQLLVSEGVLTQARADEIVTTPVTDDELWTG